MTPPEDVSDKEVPSTWRSNRVLGLFFLLLLMVLASFLIGADWAYTRVRDGILLGFFPFSALVFMALAAVGMIFDRNRTDVTEDMAAVDWRTWTVPLCVLVVLVTYFYMAKAVGFLVVTPLFLIPAIYLLGARPIVTVVMMSVLITLSVYGVFRVIGASIPKGVLPI